MWNVELNVKHVFGRTLEGDYQDIMASAALIVNHFPPVLSIVSSQALFHCNTTFLVFNFYGSFALL